MYPKSPVLLFLPNQIQIRERCYLFGVHTSTGLLFSDRATRVAEQVATKGSSATRVASSDTGLRLLAAVKPSSSALILGRWWQVMFSVRYVQTVTLVCLLTGPGRCDDCLKWIYLILYLFRAVALHMFYHQLLTIYFYTPTCFGWPFQLSSVNVHIHLQRTSCSWMVNVVVTDFTV